MRSAHLALAVVAALTGAVCTTTNDASAAAEVSGTGKGIVGGALLGGEIGFLGLAAFGTQTSWLYYTVPPALAIGGGIAGYYIEQSTAPEVPLFMLAGGMALVIPTVVLTLTATTYRPGNEDYTPSDATPAEAINEPIDATKPTVTGGSPSSPGEGAAGGAGSGGGTTTTTPPAPNQHKPPKSSSRLPAARSFALVSFDSSALRVGLPVVAMKPAYSTTEMAKFGLNQRWEVHAPLLDIAF
jgi:hypothetical protein